MKFSKYIASAVIASMLATTAFAGSIGRSSSSGSRSSSSSFSKPSAPSKSYSAPSAPAKPAVAPAPSKPGGIGGNTASVGVRKSEVTAPVQSQVAQSKPGSAGAIGSGTSTSSGYSSPSPSYGSANTPSYGGGYAAPSPGLGAGGVFASSLGGSLVGTMIGNSLFGHGSHGSGTTVINNGTPSGGTVSSGGNVAPQTLVGSDGTVVTSNGFVQPKKEYTVWSFIADLIGFVFVVAILLGIAWLLYKGFQLVRTYVNKERGVSNTPFNATQRFWEIQKAFAAADLTTLQTLLGPDVVDELTMDLQPSSITIKNVSHETRLQNASEFSIWYKFNEIDGSEINQVWHYEKFGNDWKLNGIENV